MRSAAGASAAAAHKPSLWERFDFKRVVIGVCVALVSCLGIVPRLFLLWPSLFTPPNAAKATKPILTTASALAWPVALVVLGARRCLGAYDQKIVMSRRANRR
jgi:hypothetical protein